MIYIKDVERRNADDQSVLWNNHSMYLRNKEHNPPHIHAITQDFDAPFLISTGELMEGIFPAKTKVLVKKFIMKYQRELEEMWETEEYRKLPPIE